MTNRFGDRMRLKWKIAIAALLMGIAQFRPSVSFAQFNYPNTELGNVLLRELDFLQACPACRVYLGHVGILGDWNGSDPQNPDNYDVYQQQSRTDTTNWVIKYLEATNNTLKKTTFTTFTTHNNIVFDGAPYHSYGGGWTPDGFFWHASKFDISQRDEIVTVADSLVGINITFISFPFTKSPAANMFIDTGSFRCDGIVEYIYEQAGVGSGRGLYPFYLELTIPSPTGYATNATVPEAGRAPAMTIIDGNSNPVHDGGATNSNSITITGTEDANGSGVAQIALNSDIRTESGGITATENFTSLADGSYVATVTDLAGNQATLSFVVTQLISSGLNTYQQGTPAPSPVSSSGTVVIVSSSPAGISSIAINGSSMTWPCTGNGVSTSVDWGPFLLAPGTYVSTITDCAGNISTPTTNVVSGTVGGTLTLTQSGGASDSNGVSLDSDTIANGYAVIETYTDGSGSSNWTLLCPEFVAPGPCASRNGGNIMRMFTGSPNTSFSITDQTGSCCYTSDVTVSMDFYHADGTYVTSALAGLNPGYYGNATFQAIMSDVGQTYPQSASGGQFSGQVRLLANMAQQTLTPQNIFGMLKQLLIQVGNMFGITGSDVVYTNTSSINFTVPGVSADTTTLHIYRFDGVAWDSAPVTSQQISLSTTTGVLTATGTITQGGSFAMFYTGQDSAAPVTTFSIQGSSFVFDQTLFVSTYSYAVLTATDPVVSGFASQVATITYCIDPSSGSIFSVYNSSIPLPLGTHVFQYQSYDYAGNVEAVNTTTFTVTAGTVFKEQSDDTVAGNLLVGFLGSGAQAEVVARAQDPILLQVSSANHQPMLAVTNIGSVGVGVPVPFGQLDVASSGVALQLKSGNLTSTGTSVEAAFGYNGDVAMRHALRTFHSTATIGNEMDFLVWTPASGSTTTIATNELLALQASTMASNGLVHVIPSGIPDVELEVSNGLSTGGGTMQRLAWITPSSKRFKSDISYLKEKDEDRALAETAALNHVRYRYRSRAKDGSLYDDPRQQVRVGLIYEEAPDSIRGEGHTLLTNERLANVELALKAAIRKLELLEKRYKTLKARKPQ